MTHQRGAGPDETGATLVRHSLLGDGLVMEEARETVHVDAAGVFQAGDSATIEDALHNALRKLHPETAWVERLVCALTEATREGATVLEIEADLYDTIDQSFPGQAPTIDLMTLVRKVTDRT